MATQAQVVPKSPKTQVFDPDSHECDMSVSDPAIWMDNSNDLVSDLKSYVRQKEVPSSIRLRFTDGGEASYLDIWSSDGKRCFGHLEGDELFLFLTRAVARMEHCTLENSPSMSREARNGLTVIRGGRQ